jgi:DNA-binding SARP family transcriptional activator
VDNLAVGQILDLLREERSGDDMVLRKSVLTLYRGEFLKGDSALTCAIVPREILKNGVLGILLNIGCVCEQAGDWAQAAVHFSRGINMDSLAEEFHRRLIICQVKLGNHSDAVRSYRRCCDLLKSDLGIAPSPETTAVYKSLIHQA